MTTTNSNMTHFGILMTLLLTTLCACGSPEANSLDGFQPQSPEKTDDRPNVSDNGHATEKVHAEGAYSALAYNGVCGSGYQVIDSQSVTGGTVYLTYNSSTGKNCVVTTRSTPGSRLAMCAKYNSHCG